MTRPRALGAAAAVAVAAVALWVALRPAPFDPVPIGRAYLDAAAAGLATPGYREAIGQAECDESPMLVGADPTQVRCEVTAPCGDTGLVAIRVAGGAAIGFDGDEPGPLLDAICED